MTLLLRRFHASALVVLVLSTLVFFSGIRLFAQTGASAPDRIVSPVRTDLPGRTVWAFATTGTGTSITTFAATDKGLYKSSGGAWSLTSITNQSVYAVKSRRVGNVSTLLVGTDKGVLRSTDGGNSWASPEVTTGTVVVMSNILSLKKVFDIEIVGSGSASSWFAATEKGVFRSTNDGRTWALVNIDRTADNNEVRGITVDGNTIIVNLWREGLWRSVNGGSSWAKLTIAGESALCRAVHAQQGTNATVWLAGSVSGNIWRSVNSGTSWTRVFQGTSAARSGASASALAQSGIDAFTGNGRLMFASTPSGFAWSRNYGVSWGQTLAPTPKAISMTMAGTMVVVGLESQTSGNLAAFAKTGGAALTDTEREGGTGGYEGGGGGGGGGTGGSIIPPVLTIFSITPSPIYQQPSSVALTVNGTNFGVGGGPVRFGITPGDGSSAEQLLPPYNVTPTQFTVSFPASFANTLGRYFIRAWNGRDEAAGDNYFLDVVSATPYLQSASISPSGAYTGQPTTLTLSGSNFFFSPDVSVSFYNSSAQPVSFPFTITGNSGSVITVSFTAPASGTY